MGERVQMMEHRWGARVQLLAAIELRAVDGSPKSAVLLDVSLSGALVEARVRLPLLSLVLIRAQNPGEWLEACVVRHDRNGMGLEWLDPGAFAVCELIAIGRNALISQRWPESAMHRGS